MNGSAFWHKEKVFQDIQTGFLLLTFWMTLAFGAFCPVRAEEEKADWTVLFYLCGSDLESRYGYATANLEEISRCQAPFSMLPLMVESIYGDELDPALMRDPGRVEVLIETGGSREWHAKELGMEVDPSSLQRWRYNVYSDSACPLGFSLEETLPLASMADPETLADFIRWGAEVSPAEKYALVLWDHGGGSKTGIFADELFAGDLMYLDELGQALRDGGTALECVLFDACLMANLETACAVDDNASWMVASEEVVAGKGTAISDWLQQLYYDTEADGEWLGRWICDMTQIKYSNEDDDQAQELLTWSLIDLSRISRVEAAFDEGFELLGLVYERYPSLMTILAGMMYKAEEFGTGKEHLLDLAGVFYVENFPSFVSDSLRWEMLSALKEAVVYSLRGTGRTAARGLSFCYAPGFSCQEMDVYARNCPSPHYLALLDAVSPWTAPERIYEEVDRLPEMEELGAYEMIARRIRREDGTPVLDVVGNDGTRTALIRYRVYREEENGKILCLGTKPASYEIWTEGEETKAAYVPEDPGRWPAVEGQTCCFEVLSWNGALDKDYLGNIPVQIDTEHWNLRCSYRGETGEYTVHGLWEGFDSDSDMFNRNVSSLAKLAGQDFQPVYPVYDGPFSPWSQYVSGESMPVYRNLEVTDEPLPPGTYYLEYLVYDLFLRPMPMEWIRMEWDGNTASFPELEKWEGEEKLLIPEVYFQAE